MSEQNTRISFFTLFFALFIIASAAFMRQLTEYIKYWTGEKGFTFLIHLLFLFAVIVVLVFIRRARSFIRRFTIFLLLCVGLYFTSQIKIAVERVHILEYAILEWLVIRDLAKTRRAREILKPSLFCAIVGVIDEIFQAILPYRFFDFRDILFNCIGGIWGGWLFLLGD